METDPFSNSPLFKTYGAFADENKVLLIGPSNSGKTTFRNQMINWSVPRYTPLEIRQIKEIIQENIVSLLQTVSEKLEQKEIVLTPEVKKTLDMFTNNKVLNTDFTEEMIEDSKLLVDDPQIRKIASEISDDQYPHAFSFLESIQDLIDPKAELDPSTIAKIRVRTVGFSRQPFIVDGKVLQILDMGGATMERKKIDILNCIMPKIIFFASLSDFDLPLYENNDITRFEDTMNYYKEVCEDEKYKDSMMFLILTHFDRLEERVKGSDCFKNYFPDYTGDPHNAKQCANFMSKKIIDSTMRPVVRFMCNLLNTEEAREIIFSVLI